MAWVAWVAWVRGFVGGVGDVGRNFGVGDVGNFGVGQKKKRGSKFWRGSKVFY